jgi:hypothetical protein
MVHRSTEILPIKIFKNGRSQKFRNKKVEVSINTDTGNIIQVNPVHTEGEIMSVTEKQIEVLKPYIDNVMDIIENGSIQDLLDAIDDVIVDNILSNNDEPDEEGIKLQKIYDEIYNQN